MSGPTDEFAEDLRNSATRAALVARIAAILAVDTATARRITDAFDQFVAGPLEANLARLRGHELARRNPMIYMARGVNTADEWIDRVLDDRETSAIEGHIGTWLEEVAHIVSGGTKPGVGADLQLTRDDESVVLYAIQSAPNTKNAGARKSDVDALKKAAQALRAHRKRVELRIGVLWGRASTGEYAAEPGIAIQGSDDFWEEMSGVEGFRTRLLEATVALSELLGKRSSDEVARIREEALGVFAAPDGAIDIAALANPPRPPRRLRPKR